MDSTVIIMNPAAKGEKAMRQREAIEAFAEGTQIRFTACAGDAREIAAEAVREGCTTIVAAGGDGTINEVVNGMAGSEARLGILPVGTMNVLATELNLPVKELPKCWEIIQKGKVRELDLPKANDRYFVQLAGVGLDAQVVQETDPEVRKNWGPLSYIFSIAQVAARTPPKLYVESPGAPERTGSFVLIGNGRYYGGPFHAFADARVDDGRFDVLVFNGLSYLDIIRYAQTLLFGKLSDLPDIDYFQTDRLEVHSPEQVPVEVDGEVIIEAPVTFRLSRHKLRVIVP